MAGVTHILTDTLVVVLRMIRPPVGGPAPNAVGQADMT